MEICCCCGVGDGVRIWEHFGRRKFHGLVVVVVVVLVGSHGGHGHVVVHHVDVWPVAGIGVGIRVSVAVAVALAPVLFVLVGVAGIVNDSIVVLLLSFGVGGGGGSAMNGLVQVRIVVGCAEALGQLVVFNPAVGPLCGGRGFGDSVWSTAGLHHGESSVSIDALVDVEDARTDGRQLAARVLLRFPRPGGRGPACQQMKAR